MPSIITHAVIGVASATVLPKQSAPWRVYLAAIICATLPDADVITFSLGIPYAHFLGHRGFSHSIFFALILSFVVVFCLCSKLKLFSGTWWAFVCFFFIVGASHGILDALTNGGLGIAFLAPFDNTRYFFPWTPLPVSSIGLSVMAIRWKLRVLLYEIIHIWLPISMILMTVHIAGCTFKRKT